MSVRLPMVAVCSDTKLDAVHRYHMVGHKYLYALSESARVLPIMVPSMPEKRNWQQVLDTVDGVLLTGSYSNIQPHLYGSTAEDSGSYSDEFRDQAVLPLIKDIVARGIPLLAICRGFQEMNVAYGGTLHRMVHEVSGLNDHREDKNADVDQQYAPSHSINLTEGGLLACLNQGQLEAQVNSIHMQGIDKLGEGLVVEATAADGLVEAFSVSDAAAFNLAVQWHPEWKTPTHPFYQSIFTAFGDACRQYQSATQG
jgi:putative glutamine amidotransferase